MIFDIHIRVDDTVTRRPPRVTHELRLGRAVAWQDRYTNSMGKSHLINLMTIFTHVKPNEIDDGSIILITSASLFRKNQAIYNEFVRSVRFK